MKLLTELMLDIDPADPNALSDTKRKMRMANQNPDRAIRDAMTTSRDNVKAVQKSENSPTKAIDLKIARLKQQLATLTKQRSSIAKRTPTPTVGTTESISYPEDEFEIVYLDEDDNIIHVGSILSESAIKAFKRYSNVIKKQYRCTSGRKIGKIVANPNDCNKRKEPKRIKAGRIASKKSKGIRVTKTRTSKNTAISKLVTRMNKRLSER